jgi:hypothetical protein
VFDAGGDAKIVSILSILLGPFHQKQPANVPVQGHFILMRRLNRTVLILGQNQLLLTISAKPVGVGAVSQRLIPTGEDLDC